MPIWLKRIFQFLKGAFMQLVEEIKRNQRMVDAGAQELKDKEAKGRAEAIEQAKHTKTEVDSLADDDVDSELSRWLRSNRPDSGGPGKTDGAGTSTKPSPTKDDSKA